MGNFYRPPSSRILVDTSVLIAHLRGKGEGVRLMKWAAAVGTPFVSTVSISEVAQGMAVIEEKSTRMLIESLELVDLTASLAWDAGMLLRDLRKDGFTIHLPDALIAVSALKMSTPILTHNVRHFKRVPTLQVIDARDA